MNKSIFKKQNDELLLKCLLAQRSEYGLAKKAAAYKSLMTFLFAIISVLSSWVNIDWLTAVSFLLAVLLLITSKYIDLFINRHKKHAAAVQQYFDVILYSDILGNNISEWGHLLTRSDIANAVSEVDKSEFDEIINWYSDYSSLSAEQQVFHCQRENVRWDKILRYEYKIFQIIFLIVISIMMLTVFLLVNPTLIKLICVISWFVPIADYFFTNYTKANGDIKRLSELEKSCEVVERNFIGSNLEKLNGELVSLQHKIQESRENSFLIPDWFYKYRQFTHQKKEDQIANEVQKMSKN